MTLSPLCIVAMRGSHERSYQENRHGLNGLIGKFHNLSVLRRNICKERHPGHPEGTKEAFVGMWS